MVSIDHKELPLSKLHHHHHHLHLHSWWDFFRIVRQVVTYQAHEPIILYKRLNIRNQINLRNNSSCFFPHLVPRDKGQYTRSSDCLTRLMQPQMHFIEGNEPRPDDRQIILMHLRWCVLRSDAWMDAIDLFEWLWKWDGTRIMKGCIFP